MAPGACVRAVPLGGRCVASRLAGGNDRRGSLKVALRFAWTRGSHRSTQAMQHVATQWANDEEEKKNRRASERGLARGTSPPRAPAPVCLSLPLPQTPARSHGPCVRTHETPHGARARGEWESERRELFRPWCVSGRISHSCLGPGVHPLSGGWLGRRDRTGDCTILNGGRRAGSSRPPVGAQ